MTPDGCVFGCSGFVSEDGQRCYPELPAHMKVSEGRFANCAFGFKLSDDGWECACESGLELSKDGTQCLPPTGKTWRDFANVCASNNLVASLIGDKCAESCGENEIA